MISTVLSRNTWQAIALGLLLSLGNPARADEPKDPPARAGRVANVIGDAWLFDHDTREWTRLLRNQTVGEGDRVRTDERARVAIRVGSTSLWVDERSDVELTHLDDGQTLINVDRGDVALRLRAAEVAQETRLRTREGVAAPEREGLYRVEQLDRGTKLYNFQGRLRFDWTRAQEAAPVWLSGGEQAEMWWPGGPRTERSRLYGDSFGDWVLAESRAEGDRPVARYVSPEMTGAEDLDRNGRWESSPEYGTLWIPTAVAPDWVPYRYGNWVWSRLWGWTWVDDAPWGFAPFHYGRWVSWGGRWCWSPGAYVPRPVYAPALVGWVGGSVAPGVSVGISISVGSRPPPPRYGWFPLAPQEIYVPVYVHSPRYEYRINDRADWRNQQDPITVQRPQYRYRDDRTAVSYLPAQGGAIQALPLKPDASWTKLRPLPGAPGRNDLAPVLPARSSPARMAEQVPLPVQVPQPSTVRAPVRGVERPAQIVDHAADTAQPRLGWRSEQQPLPLRRERAAESAAAALPAQGLPSGQVQPQPQVQAQPQAQPEMPWRRQRDEQRQELRGQAELRMPELPRSAALPERAAVPLPPQPQVMRQPEMPRLQMPPAPMPQVQQPAAQQRQAPRGEDAGPQRRHEGRPNREREIER